MTIHGKTAKTPAQFSHAQWLQQLQAAEHQMRRMDEIASECGVKVIHDEFIFQSASDFAEFMRRMKEEFPNGI